MEKHRKKIIGKVPEPERFVYEFTDEELMNLISCNLHEGERFPKGIYKIYKLLRIKRSTRPEEKVHEDLYLQRFFRWVTHADTIIIKEIYDSPKPVTHKRQLQKTKNYTRFDDYKGYIDEDEFLSRVTERLSIQHEYRGYKDICNILSLYPQKGANTRKQQEDWHRFFNWEVKSQRKWVITEIYDMPVSAGKPYTSVYGEESGKLLLKRLYNDTPYLQNVRLGEPVSKDAMDIMMKKNNASRIMGLNNELLTDNEIQYDEEGQAKVISKFVQRFDMELSGEEIDHTSKDLSVFKDQMSRKFRSVIEAGLNELKNRNVIIRFFYTELYYDTRTKSYGALFEKQNLDEAVSNYKEIIMKKYGLSSWTYLPRLSQLQRINLISELNDQLEKHLGVRISHGYWIRLNLNVLYKYYDKDEINSIDEQEVKSNLKEIIRQRQEISAKTKAEQIQNIYDEGNGHMTQHSNNYVEVSSVLFNSVFKEDDQIKSLGHLYLSVNKI